MQTGVADMAMTNDPFEAAVWIGLGMIACAGAGLVAAWCHVVWCVARRIGRLVYFREIP